MTEQPEPTSATPDDNFDETLGTSISEPTPPKPPEPELIPSEPEPSIPLEVSPPPTTPPTLSEPVKRSEKRHRRRGSLFFPLLLIVVGGVLLLNNLNIIQGSTSDLLVSLWPVIFIAWGLDSLWRGDGITGAVFLLGLGTVFLLGNFGYLSLNPWQVLLAIWPVLLVAIGIDILISRRRTWWKTLFGLLIIVMILAGALWLAGVSLPGGQRVSGDHVEYGLQGATSAEVGIFPAAATLLIDGLSEPEMLLIGTIPSPTDNQAIFQEFSKEGEVAKLRMQSSGNQFVWTSARENQLIWDLELAQSVPLDLKIDLGAGDGTLDLSKMQLSNLDYKMGIGKVTITLPEQGNFLAKVDGAIGQVTILIPSGTAVQIDADTALVLRSLPDNYIEQGENTFVSPGFSQVENRIILDVNLAIGWVTIKEQ